MGFYRATVTLPTIPGDDGTGAGGYEYYCQYHPFTMDGKLSTLKSPDTNGDGVVNFIDLGTVGSAFLSRPGNPSWNVAADISNDFAVNFLDLGIVGSVFLRTLEKVDAHVPEDESLSLRALALWLVN